MRRLASARNAAAAAWLLLLAPAAAAAEDPAPPAGAAEIPAHAEAAATRLASSPRHAEWVDVEMPGGPRLKTFVVYPERSTKAPVVIVVHEIFGLTEWIRAVADQLAKEGFIAVAPDLLSGMGPDGGGTEALGGKVTETIRTLTPPDVVARLNAVREHALKIPAAEAESAVMGFCWGGAMSVAYALAQPALDAAVSYYGALPTDPAAYAGAKVPILGLYGENDARVNVTIPVGQAELKKAGVSYEPVFFEGAGHGFLRQQTPDANRAAAEAAWRRTLAFLRDHTS